VFDPEDVEEMKWDRDEHVRSVVSARQRFLHDISYPFSAGSISSKLKKNGMVETADILSDLARLYSLGLGMSEEDPPADVRRQYGQSNEGFGKLCKGMVEVFEKAGKSMELDKYWN